MDDDFFSGGWPKVRLEKCVLDIRIPYPSQVFDKGVPFIV